jgi:hypothetical protein
MRNKSLVYQNDLLHFMTKGICFTKTDEFGLGIEDWIRGREG